MRHILVILGALAALAVGAVAVYQWQGRPVPREPIKLEAAPEATVDAQAAAKIRPEDHVLGKPDAPVTIIEYASLTCPHCRNFHENVLPSIKSAYIDTGKVRLVYRDFPLDRAALAASMVARCAGSARYFAMIDLFFRRQESWAGSPDPVAAMARLAAMGGMGETDIATCLKNSDMEKAVIGQRLEAEKAFTVNATPSFIIQGQKHEGGVSFESFKAVIDPLIAKAGK